MAKRIHRRGGFDAGHVLTTHTPYRDPETDYEAMIVKRNAPRWIAMLNNHDIDPATWSAPMPAAH